MVKAFIISAICFTIGNVIWDKFDDPRIFYVPLAVFMFISAWYVKKTSFKRGKIINLFLEYIVLLAAGNVIKQVFYYSDEVKQVNDLIWGGLVTLTYIIKITWATLRRKTGGKT